MVVVFSCCCFSFCCCCWAVDADIRSGGEARATLAFVGFATHHHWLVTTHVRNSIFNFLPYSKNHCNALEPLKSFEPFQLLEPLEPLKPFEPLQPPNWLVTAHVRNLMFHLNQSFTQVYRVWDAANSTKVTILHFDWKNNMTKYITWTGRLPFFVILPSSRNCDLLKLLLRRSGSDCN